MDQDAIQKLIDDSIMKAFRGEGGVVPRHIHNSIDSPSLFSGTGILESTGGGVISTVTLPSDATKFLDGTGAFSTPPVPTVTPYTVNADETNTTAYSSIIVGPASATVLYDWNTFTGHQSPSNGIRFNATTTSIVSRTTLMAPDPSGNFGSFSCETNQVIRLKAYASTEAVQSADYGAFGFTDSGSSSSFADRTNHAGLDVKFIWNNFNSISSIWCVTSNGSAVTATAVSGPPTIGKNVMNIFEIVLTPFTSAKFYINGVLVATNTTNLYVSTNSLMYFQVGAVSSGGTGDIRIKLASPVFTLTQ